MKNILSSTKAKFLAVSCLSLTFLGGVLLFPNPITQEWLFGAVENGNLKTTQLITTLNPKLLHTYDENGQTPLHLSVSTGKNDLSMIQFLILKGGNVDLKNQNGYTSLHIAAGHGNLFLAEYLIQNGASVNETDKVGDTPLHDAVLSSTEQMIEFLIQKGGNVNAKNNPYLETPLHYAVRVNKLEFVKLLISNGADIDSPNYIGITPLDLAKSLDRREIIQELEKAKGLISKQPDSSSKSMTISLPSSSH